MKSEERQKTIDFIIASQARLVAAQEQDRQDRIQSEKRHASLMAKAVEILDHQSEWMDRFDDFQRQTLHLLHMILDRLPRATT